MTDHVSATYPCPACRAPADLDTGCSGCGRPPDPDAAEVIRLDGVITDLLDRELRNRREHAELVAQLVATRERRDALAARVRASVPAAGQPPAGEVPAPAALSDTAVKPPAGAGAAAGVPPPDATTVRPEASTRGVQTLLFVVGGVLLGIGAVIFAVVAWTTFGVAGQAAILASVTVLALAVPVVARRRGLRGTAETFATLGLLLVLLDGYAMWTAGLVERAGLSGVTWAGLVFAAGALVAWGYGRLTSLAAARFAAVVLAQPVLPLLAGEPVAELAGAERLAAHGLLLAVVAAGDLLVSRRWGGPGESRQLGRALRAVAGVFTGVALALAAILAVAALALADRPARAALAGGAVLAVAAVFIGVGRSLAALRGPAAAVAVLAVAGSGGRLVALAWPGYALAAVAAVVAATGLAAAGLAAAVARTYRAAGTGEGAGPDRSPGVDRSAGVGYRVGGLVAAGVVAVVAAPVTLAQAVAAASRAQERVARLDGWLDWQLPVALSLVTVAVVALAPAVRREVLAVALTLLALSLPPGLGWAWWTPVAAGLVTAAVLGLAATRATTNRQLVAGPVAAAVLIGHALVVALAAAPATAAGWGGTVLVGAAVAAAARPGPAGPAGRVVLGRAGLLVGLVAVPVALAATTAAAGAQTPWPVRVAFLAGVALLAVAAAARRFQPGYLGAAVAGVHVVTPVAFVAGAVEGGAAVGPYAAGALSALAGAGLLRRPRHRDWWLLLRVPASLVALAVATPSVAVVLLGPYSWLDRVWTGAPAGPGVLAAGEWPDPRPGVLTLLALMIAAGLTGRVLTGRWAVGGWMAAALAPAALLVGLLDLGARWPVVLVVGLLLGLAGLIAAGLGLRVGTRGTGTRPPIGAGVLVAGYGLVLVGSGLAGLLPTRWSTLAGLGLALVAGAVVGAAGRRPAGRAAGWVGAVAAGILLAVAAVLAAGGGLVAAGFPVLGVAGLAVALGALLKAAPSGSAGAGRRGPERVALEASGHAGALVALLFCIGSLDRAAIVAALWGAVLGLRALWPAEPVAGRAGRAIAGAGCALLAWWLLLAYGQVAAVEAYTLPAALVALVAGAVTVRVRPAVGSWVGYGPALATGALPSLFLLLVDPLPVRRLLLGVAAVAVVLAGARLRLQAPVVVGGAVAVLVGLRELGLLWQMLDTWIPLTISGLLLVGLAATYERRRRDLARLRAALGRMT